MIMRVSLVLVCEREYTSHGYCMSSVGETLYYIEIETTNFY
jgi:hypothetical protein